MNAFPLSEMTFRGMPNVAKRLRSTSSSAAQPPDSPEMQDDTPSQPSTSQAVTTRQLRPPEVRRPPDRYGDFV
ncbi:hypothetical protein MTO96_013163 [Rhipicephalus appendiculatus]